MATATLSARPVPARSRETESVLVLSTGHITAADNTRLMALSETWPDPEDHQAVEEHRHARAVHGRLGTDARGLVVVMRPHGFLVRLWRDSDLQADQRRSARAVGMSRSFLALLRLGKAEGAHWLLLDADGPIEDDLPHHDW